MPETISIETPLTQAIVESLHVGDRVALSGIIYTARDAAHKRLVELIERGAELPLDLRGQVIYYVGPAPPKPGWPLGSAGPTSSYRMDVYTLALLKKGLAGMIGKGPRGPEVRTGLQDYRAVYLAATGGAGALISKSVIASEIVAYEDLGPEAIRRLTVKDFPVIVACDCHGGDIFSQGREEYRRK